MKQLLLILGWWLPLAAFAAPRTVGKGGQFPSIRLALESARDGDTILVQAGTYREQNLVIRKRVCLRGLNWPTLDGEKKYEIVRITVPGVTIEGFRVVHSGYSGIDDLAGIRVDNTRDITVRNNILDDNFFGIYLAYGTHCTIEGNHIRAYGKAELQSGNGIHCWKSDSLLVIANTIEGHRDGIYFEFVTHAVIWRNQSTRNVRYGLHFMFSNQDSYMCNYFGRNGAGVAVMFSHQVRMSHNFFEDNWGEAAYGLLLKEISDSQIDGNYFVRNTHGLYMEGTSRIRVEQNRFQANGWGMKVQASCMDNTITRNNFTGNSFDVGTNGTLVLNSFDHNYWDKYEGYDLNKDGTGDVPFHPVSLYSLIVEKNPPAMMLFRSMMTSLLDRSEKIIPSITPGALKDDYPAMKPFAL